MYDVTVQELRDAFEKISASKEQMRHLKERQGRRPLSVTKLLAKEKDGSLFKDTKVASTGGHWISGSGINVTEPEKMGRYPSKKKQGDAPTLEDGTGNPKMDSSQTVSGVIPVTKTSSADTTRQPRMAGSPPPPDANLSTTTKREDRQAAYTEPGSTTMPASAYANSIKVSSMLDEFKKIAAEVSGAEAREAKKRLKEIEESKPTGGQMARGALTGGTLGPIASLIGSGIKGDLPRYVEGALKGKVSPKGVARQLAASAVGGSMFGTAIPMANRALNMRAEEEKFKSHEGKSKLGPTRSKIKQTLGVG